MAPELPTALRVRRFLSDWFAVVVLGLVVVSLLAGFGTYSAYGSTEYETEEVVVAEMDESTSFEHSALVRNESEIWTENDRVRNRPVYYMRLMPILNVEYTYEYGVTGSQDESLDVRSEVQLIVRAVNEDQETLWRVSRPVASETSTSLSPGETHKRSVSVNMTRVARNITQIQEDLGDRSDNVQILIRAVSTVDGRVSGTDVSTRHTSDLSLVVRPPTYWTETPQTIAQNTPLETEVERSTIEPPVLLRYGGPTGLALGVVGLLGFLVAYGTGRLSLSHEERERCKLYEQRKQFDDWITRGEVPGIDQYQSVVKVSSLSGLVDLAIDTNNRVIEDENTYYVLRGSEDVAYVYAPPTSSVYDWLFGEFDFGGGEGFSSERATAGDGDAGGPEDEFGFSDFAAEFDDGTPGGEFDEGAGASDREEGERENPFE